MHLKSVTTTAFTTLNDDCLLLICGNPRLSIKDQWALLQLSSRFKSLILQIWSRKYAKEFDYHREISELKLVPPSDQCRLLSYIYPMTNAVFNLNAIGCRALGTEYKRKKERRPNNIRRLSLDCDDSVAPLLPQLSVICVKLVELRLTGDAAVEVKPGQLCHLFENLLHLSAFEWLPVGGTAMEAETIAHWGNVRFCKALQTLALPASVVCLSAREIAQLPLLHQLTVICCPVADIVDPDGPTTLRTMGIMLAALEAASAHRHLGALHLNCQLSGELLQLLMDQNLCQLRKFAWHSQLAVHYDAIDGSIKWLPQQPEVRTTLLRFLASQAATVSELNFTRNIHVTPTLLKAFEAKLQIKPGVWNNCCERFQGFYMEGSTPPPFIHLIFDRV